MVKIKNKGVVRSNNSFYFNVPKELVDGGVISLKKKYDLDVKEAEPNKKVK